MGDRELGEPGAELGPRREEPEEHDELPGRIHSAGAAELQGQADRVAELRLPLAGMDV